MKYLCIFFVRLYQKWISPLKKPCCRFTPTCSSYAVEAFSKRGFFVGFALTVWRILRCNPYCAGGYDPVPEHGFYVRSTRQIPLTESREDDGNDSASYEDTGEDESAPGSGKRKENDP